LPSSEGPEEALQRLPVSLIDANPRQPRRTFPEQELTELAHSIQARGMLQPVLVTPLPGGRYELVAGERRLRAARLAGVEKVPALVRARADLGDAEKLELALIENMAREDLNPVDAARACAALVEELGITKEEIGRRCGRSRAAIANLVRLLELPDEVLSMLEQGELSEGHGRAILQAGERGAQRALAREARARRWSVRQTEEAARASAPASSRRRAKLRPADLDDACRELEEALSASLGRPVRVRASGSGGRIEIPFENVADARRLMRSLPGRLAA
jgi:ParB family chromosome partitioning protein